MKICVECKHFRMSFLDRMYGGHKFGKCALIPDQDSYYLVTGKKTEDYCRVARMESQPCGPEGKLWEAK
jgi:hypothetical protein